MKSSTYWAEERCDADATRVASRKATYISASYGQSYYPLGSECEHRKFFSQWIQYGKGIRSFNNSESSG